MSDEQEDSSRRYKRMVVEKAADAPTQMRYSMRLFNEDITAAITVLNEINPAAPVADYAKAVQKDAKIALDGLEASFNRGNREAAEKHVGKLAHKRRQKRYLRDLRNEADSLSYGEEEVMDIKLLAEKTQAVVDKAKDITAFLKELVNLDPDYAGLDSQRRNMRESCKLLAESHDKFSEYLDNPGLADTNKQLSGR